jgi:hypothetical protein
MIITREIFIKVISANFITKAKTTFAQAFASFAPALA